MFKIKKSCLDRIVFGCAFFGLAQYINRVKHRSVNLQLRSVSRWRFRCVFKIAFLNKPWIMFKTTFSRYVFHVWSGGFSIRRHAALTSYIIYNCMVFRCMLLAQTSTPKELVIVAKVCCWGICSAFIWLRTFATSTRQANVLFQTNCKNKKV